MDPAEPLPPEAAPWTERYEMVTGRELSERMRRRILTGGSVVAAGSILALVLGSPWGIPPLVAGIGAIAAGITGGGQTARLVGRPDGRHIWVELPPEPPAAAPPRGRLRRAWNFITRSPLGQAAYVAGVSVLGAIILFHPPLAVALKIVAGGAVAYLGMTAGHLVEIWNRRTPLGAPPSKEFLELSDPRRPLAGAPPRVSAGETAKRAVGPPPP
ncbi:hypothetical protein [Longimicrobium sp.]|uniref:hypothetical protein n=1 Tax=Longimicrobium sp. TaxID=2029185 RepID=UPI002D7E86EC|nr:hypothetical protein [Longimicrobium sp.]